MFFPVHSVLRRFSGCMVLVRPRLLHARDGSLAMQLSAKTEHLVVGERVGWSLRRVSWVPMWELSASGTPEEVAMDLALREGSFAKSINAKERVYTFLCGPEEQVDLGDGKVKRTVRLGVARGIYRVKAGVLTPQKSSGGVTRIQFAKMPEGVVPELR